MKTDRTTVEIADRNTRRSQSWQCAPAFICLCFLCVLLFISVCLPTVCCSYEPIRAELGKETAWIGEAVPLIITLYSPGPFSGTAAFDFPELAQTVFVKAGNPQVGSEEIDDESYMTQRHEFALYTQRSGEIVIPAFPVRFSGKPTFVSDPQPIQGETAELRFESRRPPGTESMGFVISAASMEIQQTWSPASPSELKAGDVVTRTISRSAQGTTAMMLTPLLQDAPEAVQFYSGTPEVQDQVERGDASATRVDTVKYQFQQPGRFRLPDVTFTWWDPAQEKLQSETLGGLDVNVAASHVVPQPAQEPQTDAASRGAIAVVALFAVAVAVWLFRRPFRRYLRYWRTHYNRPDRVAARRLRVACSANDAAGAYAAFMAWLAARRAVSGQSQTDEFLSRDLQRQFRRCLQELSERLFASAAAEGPWSGQPFWREFSAMEKRWPRHTPRSRDSALPALNPTQAS